MATFNITDPTKCRKLPVSLMRARNYLRWSIIGANTLDEVKRKYLIQVKDAPMANQHSISNICRLIESPDKLELRHYSPTGDPKRLLLIVELVPEE